MSQIYQYFGSGAGVRELSNFHACRVTCQVTDGQTYTFQSVEHAYVAHMCKDPSRLAEGGDLARFETGMKIVYPKLSSVDIDKKISYWKKYNMIGIIAKMYGKMINKKEKPTDATGWETFRLLWVKILTAKYTQNKEHQALLLSTGNMHLVEFDRTASAHTTWAGKIIGGIDRGHGVREGGELVGQNYMGDMMMYIRDQVIKRIYDEPERCIIEPKLRKKIKVILK